MNTSPAALARCFSLKVGILPESILPKMLVDRLVLKGTVLQVGRSAEQRQAAGGESSAEAGSKGWSARACRVCAAAMRAGTPFLPPR